MVSKLKAFLKALLIYLHDFKVDVLYTTLWSGKYITQEKLLSALFVETHTLEKGMTMPNKRIPFGEAKALDITTDCMAYLKKGYDVTESRFKAVVGILSEYKSLGGVNPDIVQKISQLENKTNIKREVSQYYLIKRENYFSHCNDDFWSFSYSRHSCRNLQGHVKDEILYEALSLAMNTPSTCNRQSQRIYLLQSEEAKKSILRIQSGNRGFGDIADQFILITSDLSDWPGLHQRNAPYVDGGIFLMNLLYCLHYHGIAACTLNLYLDLKKTKLLHRNLKVPNNEVPIALVAIGYPPQEFDLTYSHRRDVKEVVSTR